MAPGEPGYFDGVRYVKQAEVGSLQLVEWDSVISSRWPQALEGVKWNTKSQFLWSHDVGDAHHGQQIIANKVVCLSEFHAETFPVPIEHIEIIGNGVDLSLFTGPELERNKNVLLWTSNPDRGLPLACKIFQEIRKRWPDLELHVYGRSSVYGWPEANEIPYRPRPEHSENVFMHEPLNKVGLAKVLREAWAWFYPSYWAETYCIAALEAQAAGTPVISVPLGALPETVAGGILQYDLLNSVSQLRNENRWKKLSEAGKDFAHRLDWDVRADQWLEVIENAKPESVERQDDVPMDVLPEGQEGAGT